MHRYHTSLFKKSVGVFGVLGSAVSDPCSELLLSRLGDAPRGYFPEKTRGFCKVSLLVSGLVFSNFGAHFGRISGDIFGAFGSWLLLGLSWCHLGAILALSWAILGLSWAILGRLVAVLEPSWAVLGTI